MAQQNQEVIPADPANFPLRRKRGRPRKYDSPGYEPRRRAILPLPQAIPFGSSDTTASSNVVAAASSNQNQSLNLTAMSNPRASSNPSGSLYPITSRSPTAIYSAVANSNPISSSSPTVVSNPIVQPNPTAVSNPIVLSNPTGPATVSNPVSQSNPPASSSHGPHSLLGQAVSGILDGTFEAGYLITVRVGETGPVFKGLVFDSQVTIPLSAENDIAPQVPMSRRGEISQQMAEGQQLATASTPIHHATVFKTIHPAPVPTPVHPVIRPVTVALPLQIREPARESSATPPVSHVPESLRPPLNPSPLNARIVAPNDANCRPADVRPALQPEFRSKIMQVLHKRAISNTKPRSEPPSAEPEINKTLAGSSGTCAANKESTLSASLAPGEQSTKMVEAASGDKGPQRIEVSSGQTGQRSTDSVESKQQPKEPKKFDSAGQAVKPNTECKTITEVLTRRPEQNKSDNQGRCHSEESSSNTTSTKHSAKFLSGTEIDGGDLDSAGRTPELNTQASEHEQLPAKQMRGSVSSATPPDLEVKDEPKVYELLD